MSSSDNDGDTATPSWVDLPADLVCQVFVRLEITNFIRCAAVCSPWNKIRRTNSENCRPKPSQVPWLMFSSSENPDYRYFYSLTERRTYKIHLPQISGLHIIGSADGFLVSIDEEACLYVTNPLAGAHEALPSAVTLPGFHGIVRDPSTGRITGYLYRDACWDPEEELAPYDTEYMSKYFFHKAVVVAPKGAIPTVFVIYSGREVIAFARPGDASWKALDYRLMSHFYDLIPHKGRLHAINCTGAATVYDDVYGSLEASFISPRGPVYNFNGNDKRYVVESPDGNDLYVIGRQMHPDDEDGQYETFNRTMRFHVFKLENQRTYTWKPITDVGDMSFFLGYNRSVMLSVKGLPQLRKNCIYFTDDLKLIYLDNPDTAGDMGVYDLGNGSIHPLVPSDFDIKHLNWPPALWFTPALS